MPNGKGGPGWGMTPSVEEIFIFLVITFLAVMLLKGVVGWALLPALPIGVLIGLVVAFVQLLRNNGKF